MPVDDNGVGAASVRLAKLASRDEKSSIGSPTVTTVFPELSVPEELADSRRYRPANVDPCAATTDTMSSTIATDTVCLSMAVADVK